MKKLSALITTLVGVGAAAAGSAYASPIAVAPIDGVTVTADSMANSLLSGSSGITINSVTYTGANGASGVYNNGGAVNLNSGILLTTGSVNSVPGPNNQSGAGIDNGQGGSALLSSQIGGSPTFNAATLQIKFTPTGDNVQFKYVFGSEEYSEYLNFNDVFGFFVNGVNYALIPGTSTPVSVSNLNCGPTGTGSGPNCAYFINNLGGNPDVQLDGYTQVLSFVAPVVANVENTLTLAIADAFDSILDTVVLIEGGSLSVCGGPGQPACGTVPEPFSLALFGIGLAGLSVIRKKRSV